MAPKLKPTTVSKPAPTDTQDSSHNNVAKPTAQRTRVLRQFRVVFGAVRQHFHQVEKQTGVGGAMVAALGYVQAQPGLRVSGLAVAMDVHQSTASNLVKQLVQRQLITVVKAEDDRRSVCLHLAPAGQNVLAKVSGPREGVLPRALAELSEETLEQLEHGLAELLQQLTLSDDGQTARTPLADL